MTHTPASGPVGPVTTPSVRENGTIITLSAARSRCGSRRAAWRTNSMRRDMLWLLSMSSV